MSDRVAPGQAVGGAGGDLARLTTMLDESLTLVDALGLPPEIGARLQEVIDQVELSASAPPVTRA